MHKVNLVLLKRSLTPKHNNAYMYITHGISLNTDWFALVEAYLSDSAAFAEAYLSDSADRTSLN